MFLVRLLSTSTRIVDGLICGSNCDFSTQIGNITLPSCAFIDKPSSEQSCLVLLTINYLTGSIEARLNPRTPVGFDFVAATVFSLSSEQTSLSIEFDCSTGDKCDENFVKDALRGDWTKTQNQAKSLRKSLADMLFNSTDLRPQTCPTGQPCSDQGFCSVEFQAWTDEQPTLQSVCVNSTDQPVLNWVQSVSPGKAGDIMMYTCNEPSCGSISTVQNVIKMIMAGYDLPFQHHQVRLHHQHHQVRLPNQHHQVVPHRQCQQHQRTRLNRFI